jgi:hypothetical protein
VKVQRPVSAPRLRPSLAAKEGVADGDRRELRTVLTRLAVPLLPDWLSSEDVKELDDMVCWSSNL